MFSIAAPYHWKDYHCHHSNDKFDAGSDSFSNRKGHQASSYLGSTQKDPQVLALLKEGALDVAFVTVERFFARGGVDTAFNRMVDEEKIGLIAIDEAHLISSWKSFR